MEVAIVSVEGSSIDIVNLRHEDFAGISQQNDQNTVQKIKFGTPLMDAQRRDLTLNALFYNINEGTVEDFT